MQFLSFSPNSPHSGSFLIYSHFSNFVVFRNNYFVISLKLWVVFLQKYLDVAQSRIQQTIRVEVEDHLKLNLDHFWSDMHMHTVKVS